MATQQQPTPIRSAAVPTAAERRLSAALRALAGVLFLGALVYALAPIFSDLFRTAPYGAPSVAKVTVLGLASLYASGDVRRRRGLVWIVIAAHLVSVLASAAMLAFAGGDTSLLGGGIAVDAVIAAVLIAFVLPVKGEAPDDGGATLPLLAIALACFGGAVAYLVVAFADDGYVLVLMSNAVVGLFALGACLVYAARRELALAGPVVVALVLGGLFEIVRSWPLFAVDLVAAGVVALVSVLAWRKRYGLEFLAPIEYRSIMALSEVLVEGPDEQISPAEIAANVESHVRQIRAHRRWLYRVVLFGIELTPLLTLRAPLSLLEPGARKAFLVDHFQRPPEKPAFLKHVVMIMIRIAMQLSFAGYYNDPRSWPSIGYTPFSARVHAKPVPEVGPHPLHVIQNADLGVTELDADVCIIGTGAAGSILAYELAEQGRSVLMLERGAYVEPRSFDEDEVGMIGKLYADGVMQQTEDWRFTVLQGSCVGGSTTVNNAVCFAPPERVVAGWDGVDATALYESVAHVESFLTVAEQPSDVLNPTGRLYAEQAAGRPELADVGIVRANVKDCLGCGYCNIGCKWGKKLSMLETALPWAQAKHGDRVKILSECEVDRVITRSGNPKSVQAVRATLADGRGITVRAKTYILSAGAVGSSYVLLQSGVSGVPVGKGFCCNMGAPLTAEFGTEADAYAGLQISHYGLPTEPGFAFETWFNPPVSQALNMPGWFDDHFENMRNYNRLMAVGVIVGTGSYGWISKALTGGPGINFTPQASDLETMTRGLTLLGDILFDIKGVERVMLNTWGYDHFESFEDLQRRLPALVANPDYVTLGTGHPQGGNPIGLDPKRSVVGPDFRVHGYDNLHVCDASVFPSALTVNPQLTVMSMAHYAASRIAA